MIHIKFRGNRSIGLALIGQVVSEKKMVEHCGRRTDGSDWLLLKDLYSDYSSRIKWAGEFSGPINIRQGVRQGGELSTGHYKRYDNPLLLQLEGRYPGVKIG